MLIFPATNDRSRWLWFAVSVPLCRETIPVPLISVRETVCHLGRYREERYVPFDHNPRVDISSYRVSFSGRFTNTHPNSGLVRFLFWALNSYTSRGPDDWISVCACTSSAKWNLRFIVDRSFMKRVAACDLSPMRADEIQAVPSVFIEEEIRSADINPIPSRHTSTAIATIFCIFTSLE